MSVEQSPTLRTGRRKRSMDRDFRFLAFPEPPRGTEVSLGPATHGWGGLQPPMHPFLTQQQALHGPWPLLSALVPALTPQVSILATQMQPAECREQPVAVQATAPPRRAFWRGTVRDRGERQNFRFHGSAGS